MSTVESPREDSTLAADAPLNDQAGPDERGEAAEGPRDDSLSSHFATGRWLLVAAAVIASPVMLVATWELSDHTRMMWFVAVHQVAVLVMALGFALPDSRKRPGGLSPIAIAGLTIALLVLSSASFFDPDAARTASFTFGCGVVLFAFAAGTIVTFGPYRWVARLALAALLGPYTVAAFIFGHVGIAVGTLLFFVIVAGIAVGKNASLFEELHTLRAEASERANEAEAIATTDSLTGLTNRYGLEQLDGELLQKEISAIFIDLDKFKEVNDTMGHRAGDQVLVEVAARLRRYVRPSDTVARLGGDEFFVLFWSDHEIPVMDIADRIRTAVEKPIIVDGGIAEVSASIGLSRQAPGMLGLDALIQNADEALYMAKSMGRNQVFASSLRLNMKSSRSESERSNGTTG